MYMYDISMLLFIYPILLLFTASDTVLSCYITDTEIVNQHERAELFFKLDKITDVDDLYEIMKPDGNNLFIGFPGQFELLNMWINESYRINLTVNNITSFIFQLKEVTSDDAGVYCCASGGSKVPGCGVKLIVTDKPSIRLVPPDEQPVLQQVNDKLLGELTLTCNVTSTTEPTDHNLPMMYIWFKHGIYYGNGSILNDRDVDITDKGGDIICIATDDPDCKTSLQDLTPGSTLNTVKGHTRCKDVLGTSDDFILQPEYGPYDIQLIYDDTNLKPGEEITKRVGEELTVNCMSDCNPACNISWYKDGKMRSSNQQLNLPDVQESDGGVYTCTVYNTHATRNVSFILDLKHAPEEIDSQGVDGVGVGNNVTITKTIYAYPVPIIVHGSIKAPNGTDRDHINFNLINTTKAHHYNVELRVCDNSTDYTGEYCIDVQNEDGTLTLCYDLKVNGTGASSGTGNTVIDDTSKGDSSGIIGGVLSIIIIAVVVVIVVVLFKRYKLNRILARKENGSPLIPDIKSSPKQQINGGMHANVENLIYADLDLNEPERETIRGNPNNRVVYEDIDFTKKAPPYVPSIEKDSDDDD
ncbi:uncharacterized protein LOC126830089 isoform X2 [Patella vulgata]|uniref:uncharacterized protein LOC126830089 isoform X2 n=1 Tax=Patella vulgata TaxID=6465 RepID=UPI0024A9E55F|nr:uncharacterized protein LOC126830089 isoform X2 [Patella vulgata]